MDTLESRRRGRPAKPTQHPVGARLRERRERVGRKMPDLSAARADGLRRHGADARVAVIPRGPYTLVGIGG